MTTDRTAIALVNDLQAENYIHHIPKADGSFTGVLSVKSALTFTGF
jgi:hypothetical protein